MYEDPCVSNDNQKSIRLTIYYMYLYFLKLIKRKQLNFLNNCPHLLKNQNVYNLEMAYFIFE